LAVVLRWLETRDSPTVKANAESTDQALEVLRRRVDALGMAELTLAVPAEGDPATDPTVLPDESRGDEEALRLGPAALTGKEGRCRIRSMDERSISSSSSQPLHQLCRAR
jgi:hypothetical protein